MRRILLMVIVLKSKEFKEMAFDIDTSYINSTDYPWIAVAGLPTGECTFIAFKSLDEQEMACRTANKILHQQIREGKAYGQIKQTDIGNERLIFTGK